MGTWQRGSGGAWCYIAYTGTNAIWIFRDKYRVASRHDWTDPLGVDYPLSSGTTAGLHRYGIKVQGGADEFYIDGTLLTGADVACNLTPYAMAFFGSRAISTGSDEDTCDAPNGIELFDFISYSKAWNYSTGETTTGCVIQDGPEPGPMQRYHIDPTTSGGINSDYAFQLGTSSTVAFESTTTPGGGDPEFTIALVNGRRNAIAYVQDGVEDDIASWDEELGAGYAVETVGITMYNDVSATGDCTVMATMMTVNGLCAESYTDIDREDTSGSVYFTNARLSLTTVQGLPIQFGQSTEEEVDQTEKTIQPISATLKTKGSGSGPGYALSSEGECLCRGEAVNDGDVGVNTIDAVVVVLLVDMSSMSIDNHTGELFGDGAGSTAFGLGAGALSAASELDKPISLFRGDKIEFAGSIAARGLVPTAPFSTNTSIQHTLDQVGGLSRYVSLSTNIDVSTEFATGFGTKPGHLYQMNGWSVFDSKEIATELHKTFEHTCTPDEFKTANKWSTREFEILTTSPGGISPGSIASRTLLNASGSVSTANALNAGEVPTFGGGGALGKAVKLGGKALGVVGTGLEAYDVYTTYRDEGIEAGNKKAVNAAFDMAAAASAGWIGVKVGAFFGGPIGAFCGGVVFGVIGGLVPSLFRDDTPIAYSGSGYPVAFAEPAPAPPKVPQTGGEQIAEPWHQFSN